MIKGAYIICIRPIIICVKSVHVNLYAYMCPCPARTISTVRLNVRVRSGLMYSKKHIPIAGGGSEEGRGGVLYSGSPPLPRRCGYRDRDTGHIDHSPPTVTDILSRSTYYIPIIIMIIIQYNYIYIYINVYRLP